MTSRRIVLDANIVIRAVLGVRVPELIARHADTVSFFVPSVALDEAVRHLPVIAMKRGADPAALLEALDRLRAVVEEVPPQVTEPYEQAAMARIGGRDSRDWTIVAAALALSCPVWTEDHDFFGAGVPTWTSSNVEVYLRGD
jgi:predicted nucleic acid-binding protein